MTDPTRLLSASSDADVIERALLESLHGPDASAEAKAAIWKNLVASAAALGAAGAGTALSTGSAAAHVASSTAPQIAATATAKVGVGGALAGSLGALLPKTLIAKVFVVAALGGVSGVAVWTQVPRSRPMSHKQSASAAASGVRTRQAVASPVGPVVAFPVTPQEAVAPEDPCTHGACGEAPTAARARDEIPTAPRAHDEAPSASRAPREHKARPHDSLMAESGLLTAARAALRANDLDAAKHLLTRLSADFPRGVLQQEREVLQIELLSARGEHEAASRRALRFIERHPESPHSEKLKRFTE